MPRTSMKRHVAVWFAAIASSDRHTYPTRVCVARQRRPIRNDDNCVVFRRDVRMLGHQIQKFRTRATAITMPAATAYISHILRRSNVCTAPGVRSASLVSMLRSFAHVMRVDAGGPVMLSVFGERGRIAVRMKATGDVVLALRL